MHSGLYILSTRTHYQHYFLLYRGNPGWGTEARPPGSGGLHGAHPDDHDEGQRLHQVHERPPAGHGEGRQTHPHHRGGRR